nr:MAG TPA: hypothetical protein [Caudoviricetes sp.]
MSSASSIFPICCRARRLYAVALWPYERSNAPQSVSMRSHRKIRKSLSFRALRRARIRASCTRFLKIPALRFRPREAA